MSICISVCQSNNELILLVCTLQRNRKKQSDKMNWEPKTNKRFKLWNFRFKGFDSKERKNFYLHLRCTQREHLRECKREWHSIPLQVVYFQKVVNKKAINHKIRVPSPWDLEILSIKHGPPLSLQDLGKNLSYPLLPWIYNPLHLWSTLTVFNFFINC